MFERAGYGCYYRSGELMALLRCLASAQFPDAKLKFSSTGLVKS
jgi:hypothetical protein